MNALTPIPLTMSSLEIAGLANKHHRHVLRDIRKMLNDLGIAEAFAQKWAKVPSGGRPLDVINLPKRETLILVTGYSVPMRARIIDRWQELEAVVAGVQSLPTELDGDARRVIGGIVKGIVHKELVEIIPDLVRGELASRALLFRTGKTAGAIWSGAGLPKLKGAAVWFGNRLVEMGCQIPDAMQVEPKSQATLCACSIPTKRLSVSRTGSSSRPTDMWPKGAGRVFSASSDQTGDNRKPQHAFRRLRLSRVSNE